MFPPPSFMSLLGHDLRLAWRDRAAIVSLLAFAACLGIGFFQSHAWHRAHVAMHLATLDAATHRTDSLGRRVQAAFADTGLARRASAAFRSPVAIGTNYLPMVAFLPPSPLGTIAVGQGDLFPAQVRLTPRSFQSLDLSTDLVNPRSLLEGRFDPAFVVIVLLPLLLIGLTHDLISGERERGTLRLLASLPTAPTRMLASRLLARVLPPVLVLGAGVLAVAATGGGAAPGALLLWTAGVLAYTALWLGVALLVNSYRGTSATNAMVLAGIWLATVVVGPALIHATAQWLHPPPSRVALVGAQREASRDANARAAELLQRYLGDHPELAPEDPETAMQDFMSRTYSVQDEVDRLLEPMVQEFEATLVRQQALTARWSVLFPAALLHAVSTEAAGSGTTRFRMYHQQLRTAHAAWQAHFIPPVFQQRELTLAEFEARPRWTPPPVIAPGGQGRMALAVGWLVLLTVVVWIAAWRRVGDAMTPSP